jgi:RNA polymerase sigma factor (sigma-70 family)
MLSYQAGDTRAFESLYRRHKDGLFAFLYRGCPRQAIVEELAQDTWMAVIDTVERYSPKAKFRTWLYQIAHNRSVDFWRRRDNKHASLEDAPEIPEYKEQATDLGRHVLRQQLSDAVASLPEEQRTALLLQEQGFSNEEISEITHCGTETVKSRLRYARNQLRNRLGDKS